jgi:hypothetical protein
MNRTAACLGLLLAACASYDGRGLQPGMANEGEVRRTMGEPALELRNPDGTRQMAYPKGPLGTQTYMAYIGRDGVLEAIRPVLNEDRFYQIHPGQDRDEVLRLIGPPSETGEFPRLRQTAWDYRFQDTWGYLAIFSVMFDEQGRVVGKVTRRLDRERRFP